MHCIVSGVESFPQLIKCGVPQGSNLGPLLFMLFINDLPNSLKHCCVSLYADDTCVYYSGKTPVDIECKMNSDLQNISEWLSCNRLALNTQKCEVVLIGLQKRTKGKSVNLFINKAKIDQVTQCKYLGVYFDSGLTWDKQVGNLLNPPENLYLLKIIRHCISQKTALLFYKAIAQSKLDCCDCLE